MGRPGAALLCCQCRRRCQAHGLLAARGAWQESRAAYIVISPDVVQVQMFGGPQHLVLGPHELRPEAAARTALRDQVAAAAATGTERYETRLRAVGTVLDEEPTQSFAILVTRRSVIVEGAEDYYNVFTNDDLSVLLRAIAGRRTEASAE